MKQVTKTVSQSRNWSFYSITVIGYFFLPNYYYVHDLIFMYNISVQDPSVSAGVILNLVMKNRDFSLSPFVNSREKA